MLQIRPLLESDLAAAMHLSTQAGWNQVEADWLRLIRLWPGQCLAGCMDGRVIGTATLASHGGELAWIGMILVDQVHRSCGYGTALFDAIVGLARRHNIHSLGLDATDLGRPLYAKCGFVPAWPINRWVGTARPADVDGSAMPVVGTDWAGILSLDRTLTGLERASLLRLIAAEPGVVARIVRDSGQSLAFALARPGRTAAHIGPVLARSSDAAAMAIDSLLHELSLGPSPCPVLIDIPGGNPLEPVVAARGFAIKRRLTRMYQPRPPEWLPVSNCPLAAIGFELG